MVAAQSLQKTLETCLKPYEKELGISFPIEWEENECGMIKAITDGKRRVHMVSYDPDVNKYRERKSELPFLLEDEDRTTMNVAVSEWCGLHIAERVDPVLSRINFEGSEDDLDIEMLSAINTGVVSVLVNDVMYGHLPEKGRELYDEQGEDLMTRIVVASEEEMPNFYWQATAYEMAYHYTNLIRHRLGTDSGKEMVAYVGRVNASLQKMVIDLTREWSTMPKITYKRQRDLGNYVDAIQRTAKIVRFDGTLKLRYKGDKPRGRHIWVIEK